MRNYTMNVMLIVFIFYMSITAAAIAETITLVADEWPPFNAVPNSQKEGLLVDVARTVFEEKGIQVSYQILPWKRAVEMTRDGLHNGLIGASKTDAPGFIFPDEELSRNYISFYVRKGSKWKFVNRKDVEQVALGVISGYDYRKWLLEYITAYQDNPDRIQIMTGDKPLERNLLKLIDGRIDAVVDNGAVIINVARNMGVQDKIALAGRGTEPSNIYIAFSPNHPESKKYAAILSQGMLELRKDGRLQKILLKYGLTDWK